MPFSKPREPKVNSTTTSWNDTQKILAFIVVCSFIIVLFILTLFPPKGMDQTMLTLVNVLLGALVAKFSSVVDYYFGSSRSSTNKDSMIAALATPPTNGGNGHSSDASPATPATPAAG